MSSARSLRTLFVAAAALVVPRTVVLAQSAATPAPRVSSTLPPRELAHLEDLRRAVWVDWFSGDTAALRRALGPELVAMSTGARYWESLEESLAASAAFRASGGRFVSVAFDSSTVHRFGETVVMFSRYHVTTTKGGVPQELRGRATEVFVRSDGRWVHTSWHLDATP